jgi:hypothetical protein
MKHPHASSAKSAADLRRCFRWVLALGGWAILPGEAYGIPFYARSRGLSCVDCHTAAPKLNAKGEEFLARGYRRSASGTAETAGEFPISAWITGRHEDRSADGVEKNYVPKVELISGGPIGDSTSSYFIEWRVVSLDVRGNGTLRDRGGRFEDAFVNWDFGSGHALRVGQFRALNQYDVSLRLSVSEPTVFSTALAGEASRDARITGLRAFSPAGRSPGIAYTYQSMKGPAASDGLFHIVNVPFVGELSLPLSEEARREASFELEGPAKGVFLETFYRRKLNSIGAHAFFGNNRRLLMGMGRLQSGDLQATGALGLDDSAGRSSRTRYSLELEYLSTRSERFRPGAGFRIEQITRSRRDPAYIPYLVFAGPNTHYTFLLQVEARFQGSARTVFVDLSTIF